MDDPIKVETPASEISEVSGTDKDIQDILDGLQIEEPSSQPIVEGTPASDGEPRMEQPNPEAPIAEAKPEGETPNEVEFLRQELQKVSAALVEIQGKTVEKKQAPEIQDREFIKEDVDVNELLSGREQLNALMNQVRKQTMADTREQTLADVSDIIGPEVDRRVEQKLLIERFYAANPDLSDKREYITFIGSQVIAEKPEITYTEFFQSLEKKARQIFPKGAEIVQPTPTMEQPTGLVGPGRARAAVPTDLSGVSKDIADIMAES